jgi:hypothetical protein
MLGKARQSMEADVTGLIFGRMAAGRGQVSRAGARQIRLATG